MAKAHQMQLCFASFYAFRVYSGSRESVEPGDESPIRLKLVFFLATAVVFAERLVSFFLTPPTFIGATTVLLLSSLSIASLHQFMTGASFFFPSPNFCFYYS